MRCQTPIFHFLNACARDLSEIIGQDHLLGEHAPLRQMIDQGHLPSIIFWGPPGVGKTTIALLLAQAIDRPFVSLSALNTGVKIT